MVDSVFWTPNSGIAIKNNKNQCLQLIWTPFGCFGIWMRRSCHQLVENVSILCQVQTFVYNIMWKIRINSVHTFESMDSFFTQKFERERSMEKFMLSCVNSCPHNSRFVVNFTEISQIYVRKIQICSRKSRLGLFTFNIFHTLRSLDTFFTPFTKFASIHQKWSENTLSIHVEVWILSQISMN